MRTCVKSGVVVGCCLSLFACASPPKTEFVKDGATDFDRSSALSECTYQIKLGKVTESEQEQLLNLCMEGKGYRSSQIR